MAYLCAKCGKKYAVIPPYCWSCRLGRGLDMSEGLESEIGLSLPDIDTISYTSSYTSPFKRRYE